MKFRVTRRALEIVPESEVDEAYIEDTLGLRRDCDAILLVRKNALGLMSLGHLTTSTYGAAFVEVSPELRTKIRDGKTPMEKNDMLSASDLSPQHFHINEVMQWFKHDHLPEHLQEVVRPIAELAQLMVTMVDEDHGGPELTKGLAKLLEAKDCFVRSAIRAERIKSTK